MSSSSSQPLPQQSIATEDMISTLPDSILSHILSFLPTKYAAATRVLSKRWNPLYPLWLSILTLDFDVQSFEDLNTFLHAVYPNMLPIQRFINAAIQRGIENLTLEKVYELKLTRGILSVNLRCPHLLYIVHTFHNLTQIELFFLSYKGKIWSEKWRWMLEVLQQSPKLQHLAIHQEMENVGIYEANWEDPQIIPHCLSSQLKTCLFRDFRGTKNEIQFAEYVMQNSKALCTMTIHSVCSIDLNAKYQMLQKLSVCPRDCELIFD